MKSKLYDEYTDDEILVLINNFNCDKKSSIFLTLSDFLSRTLLIEDIPTYFLGWKKIEYELNNIKYNDCICIKKNSGYYFYTLENNTSKVGEFLGVDYIKSLKGGDFRSVILPYPTTISNFIKTCNSNFIELYWNLKVN